MKILCTADWHIGKKLGPFSRLEEQKLVLDQIVSLSAEQQSDAVIVAGDCFDTQSPSPEMAKLFVSTLARLSRGGECPVLVIAGNHDSPLFLSSSEAFASQVGVVILGYPQDTPSLEENHSSWKVMAVGRGFVEILFKKSKKTIRFLMSPYANAQRLKKDLGVDDVDKKAWEILSEEWEQNLSHEDGVKNILITHSALSAEKQGIFPVEEIIEYEGQQVIGTMGLISLSHLPLGIDYVIAGHIHRPQYLYSPKTKAFYTGSPLIYSTDDKESGQEKSILFLDLGKKDKEYCIPLTVQRDVKKIVFDDFETIGEILEQEKENYVILIWEGDRYISSEEHQYLRNAHARILDIKPQPKTASGEKLFANIQKIQEQSTKELFVEYFQSKYQDQLPPEDLLSLLDECLNEESTPSPQERKREFLPKSLKIKGFYSYKDEAEVDFTFLEQKGFFGIFGNTGSGKSAIIEAMIFALYNQMERVGARGKGNYSTAYGIMNLDSQNLLIEFVFEINGVDGVEEYLCRVSGTRNRKRRTEVNIKRAVLIKDQGEWITTESFSGEDLLGITYNDFRKTIVLQQGDFLGFISAGSKDTSEILMRLFQLERFELFQAVGNIQNKESVDIRNLENKIQNLNDCTEQKFQDLQNQHKNLKELSQKLGLEIDGQRGVTSRLKQKTEQYQEAQNFQKQWAEMQEKKKEFTQAKERLRIRELESIDTDIVKAQLQIQSTQEKISTLEQAQKETAIQLQKTEEQGKSLTQDQEKLRTQINNLQGRWEQSVESNLTKKIFTLKHQIDQYQGLQKSLQGYEEKIVVCLDLLTKKDDLTEELSKVQAEEQEQRSFQGLEGITLKEGCPCPLCGSEEHPHPYQEGDSRSLDELVQSVRDLQQKLSNLHQKEEDLQEYQEQRDTLLQQKDTLLGEYETEADLQREYNLLGANQKSQEEEQNLLKEELRKGRIQETKQEQEIQSYREKHSRLQRKHDQDKFSLEHTQKENQEAQEEQTKLREERVLFMDKHKLTEFSYEEIKKYPQKSQEEVGQFFEGFLFLSGRRESFQEILQEDCSTLEKDLERQTIVLRDLMQAQEQHLEQSGSLNHEIKTVEEGIREKALLQEQYEVIAIRQKNFKLLKQLFEASAFVHYIGQKYLQKLCFTANKRFVRFTQNQFELSLPDESEDKKGCIVVVDRLAGGNKRDMLTLSGGQSFQAALALALALADESGAGHRFFFIDEGFGSLDQESLALVLSTLRLLVEEENRVVGVISHVPLMKEEVSAYLQVDFDPLQGTRLELLP